MNPEEQQTILPHLFRKEYSKIVAVLYHSFRLKHLEAAEDIASATFLKATEVWAFKGVPKNPTAWLYTVARNKVRDHLRHLAVADDRISEVRRTASFATETDIDFTQSIIADSQLAMIFSVCDPRNSDEAQVCLALQILCGFSVGEIANAFLTNPETIKKRLLRAREILRENDFHIAVLSQQEITVRLERVLKTLYLLFNEGYLSTSNDELIRKDLCCEAMRLMLVILENPSTSTPKAFALLALMCFQSSRLDARIDHHGDVVLLDDQDQTLWNLELIQRGNRYLMKAYQSDEISRYHLEATIAYWHTTPRTEARWPQILQLYNQLIIIEYSPVTALSRAFAYAKVYGHHAAIAEAEKLRLNDWYQYHSLLGYLYGSIDKTKAIAHYENAITLAKSPVEIRALTKASARLKAL